MENDTYQCKTKYSAYSGYSLRVEYMPEVATCSICSMYNYCWKLNYYFPLITILLTV